MFVDCHIHQPRGRDLDEHVRQARENGVGAWIGDVPPEHTAELVRNGISRL